ncbi:MAG: hypothetical protein ACKVY0_18815 [Prosthecobacter sp.]|uniref:hypothetical protein n=1 Tax=Prosthecobacter sp. TaxID=1965333 RepID=UPI0038FF5B94
MNQAEGLALETGLPLHDGSPYSVQQGLHDWHIYYHGRLAATDGTDEDGDGLGPLLEQVLGTNAALKDSDGDCRPDGWAHYPISSRLTARQGGSQIAANASSRVSHLAARRAVAAPAPC